MLLLGNDRVLRGGRLGELPGGLPDPVLAAVYDGRHHRPRDVGRLVRRAGIRAQQAARVAPQPAKRGEVPNIPTKPDMGYRAANALIAPGLLHTEAGYPRSMRVAWSALRLEN